MTTQKTTKQNNGTLFVLTGPSGAGKGTVLAHLFQTIDDLYYSVSATTRPPREGEVEGKDYFFLQKDQFMKLVEQDALLEYAEYVDNFYGTPIAPITEQLAQGRDVVLEIEVQGALKVKQKCPDAVLVFVAPPSLAELRNRLERRGTESAEIIEKRMQTAMEECAHMKQYDYIVTNHTVEEASDAVRCIVIASRCESNRYAGVL